MKQQGSVLLAALLVMVISLFVGSLVTRLMATELEISDKFSDGIAAFYAAEAGVKRAFVELDNRTSYNNFTEILKNSNYRVIIRDGGNKQEKVITAVGQKKQAVRKATAYVSLTEIPRFACFAGGDMILSARIIGAVGLSGQDITIKEGGGIEDFNGNEAQPEFDVKSFKIPLIKTSFNENIYKNAPRLSNFLEQGSYSLQGVYYIDGDFVLQDAALSVNEGATIFVRGSAVLSGNVEGNITLISTNTVTINNTGGNIQRMLNIYAARDIFVNESMAGQVLMMTKGDAHINGSIHGAVIAEGNIFVDSPVEGSVLADKAVVQSSSGQVTYDEHIFRSLGLARPQVIAWDF